MPAHTVADTAATNPTDHYTLVRAEAIAAVTAGEVLNDVDETSGVGRIGTTSRLTSELR